MGLLLSLTWPAPGYAGNKVAAIATPIDFSVVSVGIKGTELQPEPTAQAKDKLEHSLEPAFVRVGTFQRVPLPPMSSDETAAFNEELALVRIAVLARAGEVLGSAPFDRAQDPPDYSIGPGLAFLAELKIASTCSA